ncbi:uncharacterized protein RAG0_06156 [Rhynchosporium agropyri]|uniref:Uncharacterized protein n=1 Tax=Rhynchosporium agropyri TaxID=914238 RepID=A0A1E1KG98_9HELO|nr:uncharacterized protein RAG0_06156 [Rhynchosporium agropyri]
MSKAQESHGWSELGIRSCSENREKAGPSARYFSDTKVLSCTGSEGLVRGSLSGVQAVQIAAGQRGCQRLLARILDEPQTGGVSVMETVGHGTGDVYGYILSEFTGTGSAFIISFYEIFQDMVKSLEKFVKSLTMDSLLYDLQMTTKQITNADPRS